jgi:hypothetical protein
MPKRTNADAELRATYNKVFRRLRAMLQNHWEMAASFTCNPDPELGRRLISSRAAFLELLDTALPVPVSPTALTGDEDEAEPASVH